MKEFAKMCRDKMRRGEMPPRNWQYRVTKYERKKIYDAWVDWYIDLVKSGKPLPKRGGSLCFKGLTDEQKDRIYSARGFGPTTNMKAGVEGAKAIVDKINARHEWLKTHGGQHTQDVMEAAKIARHRRLAHLREKRANKITRKLKRLGLIDWFTSRACNNRYLNDNYFAWCRRRREDAERTKWCNIRREIISEAKAYHARTEFLQEVIECGIYDSFVKIFRDVGLENLEKYTLTRLPYGFAGRSKWLSGRFSYLIGMDLLKCLGALKIECDESRAFQTSETVKRNGSNKTSDAHAQLRALGFVA